MDESDRRELLAVFLLDAPGRVERIDRRLAELKAGLRTDARTTALAEATFDAHRLRGAAGTVGLDRLGELAEQLELALRELGADGADAALERRARELTEAIGSHIVRLEAVGAIATPAAEDDSQQHTVLHVEDDPVNARLIERALARRPGIRVLTARRAESGMALARKELPDLVLVDLHLPDGSGTELVRRLRTDPATRALAVVLVTADDRTDLDPSGELQIRELLPKPVDVGRLLELVDELAPTASRRPSEADLFRDREIVEAVPNGIVLLDRDGLVLDVNPATERLLGYSRAELVGNPCEPFTHPDDHRGEAPLLEAVLAGESDGYTIEKRYLRKSGEPVWARLDLRSIRDDQGRPRRLLALLEDVTERRRLDEEQKRLTEQVRTILESVTDGFVALDRDWRYTYVNERAGELLGRSPEELIGKNIWEEFPDGIGQPFHAAYEQAMTERTTVFFEEYYEPWDRWFENRVYGSETGITIYFTEVTERKRVEAIERRQRERADALREVDDALTRTLDLKEVLSVLLESLTAFVPYTSASVLLRQGESGLEVGALNGYEPFEEPELAERLAELSTRPLVRQVLEGKRLEAVDADGRDSRRGPLLAPAHVRSWFSVPLRAGGHVIGLCTVESSREAAFGEADVDWAEAVTAHAAAAIENARLHDELRRHADELERRIAELDEAQRVAHVGSFEWDIVANSVSWSDELYRIYGLDPASFEATFEAFVERIHPDDRAAVTGTIRGAVESGQPFRMQERIIRPTGELRYLESWGEVSHDDAGRPIRLLGICHDVTEDRRQRERTEALRDANDAFTRTLDLEQVLGVLLDSLTSFVHYTKGIVLLLTDDSKLVVGASRGYDELDAQEVNEVVGRSWVPTVLAEGRTIFAEDADARSWIAAPLRAGGQVIGVCAVESSDDASFGEEDVEWVEALTAQAAAGIENARLHYRLGRHAAELEQRVAERTLDLRRAKEEAERANRAKSDFLTGISHELRTPMNAILGFAQLLDLDDLGGEQGDNVRQILRAGSHLLELITELLDIARIEAGELALSLESVSVDELVREAVNLTRPLADQHEVTISCDDDRARYVLADRHRLLQVLLNLLANAVKYNRRGGRVEVGFAGAGGDSVAIAVRDTGHGIAPDDLERLFAPFERLGLDGGTVEGAGLGLTLAQRLVEAMDGTLAVESTPGVGSTFTIELPVAVDPLAALETVTSAPALANARATIVYIEDNVANRQLVERALGRQPNLEVLTATEGQEGLELVRRSRPDLVLLDLHLPDISGEEILDELAAQADTAAIPVVVVSAAASKGRVQRLYEGGARAYLTKPIDLAELFEVVRAVLAERSRSDAAT